MSNGLRVGYGLFLLVWTLACSGVSAQENFDGWNLEPGVGQAHLIMVARVASISRLTIVEGAKTDVALREYRFQPVRRLKGVFQRDQLSMTAADLGCPAEDSTSVAPLKEGEYRLLILGQSQQGGRSTGCVSATPGATTFEQRVPLLTGPDDPLVAVVETLIRVADSRSRRERASLLVERLKDVKGVAAIPLLTSLRLRADWAAADDWLSGGQLTPIYVRLVPLTRDSQPAVRRAAVDVLRALLATRSEPIDPGRLDGAAEALREIVLSEAANGPMRLSAIETLGHLVFLRQDLKWARALLVAQLTSATTYAERDAAVTALSRVAQPGSPESAALLDAFARLPLDEQPAREMLFAKAMIRLLPSDEIRPQVEDIPASERALVTRLQKSIEGQHSLESEIKALSQMRSKASLPLLLNAANQTSVSANDQFHLAVALGNLKEDQAVPVLAGWMRQNLNLKATALMALENIDSPLAAQEVRPLLKSESHLPYKLRMARLLARHQIPDGYALATEHLADEGMTGQAVLVLAALNDPRTSKVLSEILAARPDRSWHVAALTALVAIGDTNAKKQLLAILSDDRSPMAAEAVLAVGLAGDVELISPLADLVHSRNDRIAAASLIALQQYLRGVRSSPIGLAAVKFESNGSDEEVLAPVAVTLPSELREAISKSIESLVLDTYVEIRLREQALAIATLLRGERYEALLTKLADQAELEGTSLLAKVVAERRRMRDVDKQP